MGRAQTTETGRRRCPPRAGRWDLAVAGMGRRLVLALALVAVTGCATQRIDWDSRIGTYTHDDAVRELGPPDKTATLSDGTVVADWLTNRGMRTATAYGGGVGPYGRHRYGMYGPGYIVVDPPSPDRFLRLTFDPAGKLASWARVYR